MKTILLIISEIVLLTFLLFLAPSYAADAETANNNAAYQNLERRIQDAEQIMVIGQSQLEQLLIDISEMDSEMSEAATQSDEITEELINLNTQVENSNQEITILRNQLNRVKNILAYKQEQLLVINQNISDLEQDRINQTKLLSTNQNYTQKIKQQLISSTALIDEIDEQLNTPSTEPVSDINAYTSVASTAEINPEQELITTDLLLPPVVLNQSTNDLPIDDSDEASIEPYPLTENSIPSETDSVEESNNEEYVEIIYTPNIIVPSTQVAEVNEKDSENNNGSGFLTAQTEDKINKEQPLIENHNEAYQNNWAWLFQQPAENYTLKHGVFTSIQDMENSPELNKLLNYEIQVKRLGSDTHQSYLLSGSQNQQAINEYKKSSSALVGSEIINIGVLQKHICEVETNQQYCI